MEFKSVLIAVIDIERAKRFYHTVLGLEVIEDFGVNVTLTGGIVLQTMDTWSKLVHKKDMEIILGHHSSELYFEEDDIDGFYEKLQSISNITYVHSLRGLIEHSWGQRVVRFYDLDWNIIEVAESLETVVKRFIKSGLSIEETAIRMDVPQDYVESCLVLENGLLECSCKKKKCERYGNCEECIAYHEQHKYLGLPYCKRKGKSKTTTTKED